MNVARDCRYRRAAQRIACSLPPVAVALTTGSDHRGMSAAAPLVLARSHGLEAYERCWSVQD